MNGLDLAVFRSVNGLPEGFAPFFVFLSEATKTREGLTLLVVLFVASVAFKPTRKPALLAMVAWPLADATTNVLKHAWQWPRPCWDSVLAVHPDFHVRTEHLDSFGTASAHSANTMAVAVAFLWLYRPAGWFWLAVAVFTGMSRVYVGVHYPSQVVLGWLCGAVAGTVVVKTWEAVVNLRQAKASEPPEERPEAS